MGSTAVNVIGLATGAVIGGIVAKKAAEDLPVILENSKIGGGSKPEPKTQPKAQSQPKPKPKPQQPKKLRYTEKDAAKETGVKEKEVARAWHDARDDAMKAGWLDERQVRKDTQRQRALEKDKNTKHMEAAIPDLSRLILSIPNKTIPAMHYQAPPRHHYQPPPPSVQPFATSNDLSFKFSF
jgi:hypothetical protein